MESKQYITQKSQGKTHPCPADQHFTLTETPQRPTHFAQMGAAQLPCELCAFIHHQILFHLVGIQVILQTVTLQATIHLLKSS